MAVEWRSSGPPSPRCQVRRFLLEKQRYTLELLEPLAGSGGAGQRMDVRPANFTLVHLSAGTRCASRQEVSSAAAAVRYPLDWTAGPNRR